VRCKTILIAFVVIILIGFSCKNRGDKGISEGEIHYNIEYRGNTGRIPKEMLPKTLVIYFNQNKILVELLSVFGSSGIVNLTNHEDEIYDTYFSFFSLKYYYEASKGELFPGFEAMEGIKINKTQEEAIICGFHCKNAKVTLPSDRNKILSIWYTDDINVKSSNIATPFKEIDGVLMDFSFFLGETEIHCSAENVYSKTVNDNTFARRKNYQKVSKEEITGFINTMMNF